MSLRLKFNLVMMTGFLIGLLLAALLVNGLSQRIARRAVLSEAAIMMGQANATIHYTDTQVSPLLNNAMKVQFIPEAIPFFAAQRTFDRLSQQFPDYSFRQPTLNPTNPVDRPAPWERDIISTLGSQPRLTSLITERKTAAGEILSYSQPVRVSSQSCLSCHSMPQAAPAAMIDVYGSGNGFGWKMGDLVGAETVSVPERRAFSRARQSLYSIMGGLFAVFAVMMVLLNLLLHLFIIVPIRRISRIADEVSLGNMDAPEFEASGEDEIGSLSLSFNRMRRSLAAAFRMLEE
jgi:protein-histidine pros-kinase